MTSAAPRGLHVCRAWPGAGNSMKDGNRGLTGDAADRPDAGQGRRHGARRSRNVVVRAEVGRVPCAGVPRRRRGGAAVAQRQGPRPLLPRIGRRAARRTRAALRARRRGRGSAGDRRPDPAGLGFVVAADPPRREPGADARRADSGALHRFRCAGHRGHLADGLPVPGTTQGAVRSGAREAVVPRHAAPPRTPISVCSG